VDDGSTDGSSDAIQRFLAQRASDNGNAREVHYLSQANQGPSAARNRGTEQARGEYLAFLDSDDVWLPDKLEWQLRAIEPYRSDCGACFTDTQLVSDSDSQMTTFRFWGRHYDQPMGIEPDAVKLLATSFCGFWVSTLLVRTDLIRQIGGFDPAVKFAEDRDFCFRLSLVTSLAYVNKVLARVDRTSRPNESKCRPWDHVEVRLRGRSTCARNGSAWGRHCCPMCAARSRATCERFTPGGRTDTWKSSDMMRRVRPCPGL